MKIQIAILAILLLPLLLLSQIDFPRHILVGKSYPYRITYPGADSLKVIFYHFIRHPNAYYPEYDTTDYSDTLRSTFCTSKEGHWKLEVFIYF